MRDAGGCGQSFVHDIWATVVAPGPACTYVVDMRNVNKRQACPLPKLSAVEARVIRDVEALESRVRLPRLTKLQVRRDNSEYQISTYYEYWRGLNHVFE